MFDHGITVTRRPYERTDRNAHRAEVVGFAGDEAVENAGFDPESTSEVDGRQVVTNALLFISPDQAIHPLDQWLVGGEWYAVTGRPARIVNHFTGTAFRTEIQLRRVVG